MGAESAAGQKRSVYSNTCNKCITQQLYLGRVKRIWHLSPMRAAKVQASLRIRAVSPEPPLLTHTSNESKGTFRQKARSLASLNGWACAVKIFHDGMLEDTNSLDGAHFKMLFVSNSSYYIWELCILVLLCKTSDKCTLCGQSSTIGSPTVS